MALQVYTGACSTADLTNKKGVGYRVVMDLMERYQGRGHCLYVDNFYTSPQLLMDPLEKRTYCAGTIRTNRKDFPNEILPAGSTKMSIGSFRFASTSNLIAVWWLDRRDVYAMSNMHNMSVTVVMKRPKGCKNKVPTSCPSIIADYNVNMGGVDLTDQHLSYYSMTNRKTIKWWICAS